MTSRSRHTSSTTPTHAWRRLLSGGTLGLVVALLLATLTTGTGAYAASPTAASVPVSTTVAGDCGCTEKGDYEAPAGLVAPNVEPDGSSSAPGEDHQPRYRVTATGAPPTTTLTVRRVDDSSTVLTLTTAATKWGFSPDEQRFVTHRVVGGLLEVQVYDLTASKPATALITQTVQVGDAELGFSPDGAYFGIIHLWSTSGTTTSVLVFDAATGRTAYSTTYSFSVPGSAGKRFGAAGWGFSPTGHGFLLAYVSGQSSVEATLVDLRGGRAVLSETLTGTAHWHFSPCGSMFALVTQNDTSFMTSRLVRVADGEVLATRTDPVGAISFEATEASHVARVGGTTRVLAPNPGCSAEQPPTWPAGSELTASDVAARSLTLSWTAATDDVAVTDYRVRRGSTTVATVPGSQRTLQVTGLQPGTTYTFSVEAGDAGGGWSTDGPTLRVTTAASVPTWPDTTRLVARDVTNTSVTLRWTEAATDEQGVTGHRVYRDGTQIATLGAAARTHVVDGLAPGTTYTFTVQAVDGDANLSTDGPQTTVTTDDFEQLDVPDIRGTIYDDENLNGRRDDGERGIDGHAYPYVGFSAYRLDGTRRLERVWTGTDGVGRFTFDGLADGTWLVALGVGPRIQTTPADLQPQVVQIRNGAGWGKVDFGLTDRRPFPEEGDAKVRGVVYEDADRDGVRDAGEAPLSGMEIACGNVPMGGACHPDSVTSGSGGAYEIGALIAGTIDLSPSLPEGSYSTGHRVAAVSSDETVEELDLGVVTGTATVTGQVFHDRDRDGVRDSGEPGLGDTRVCAVDRHFRSNDCIFTDDDGTYRLPALPHGTIELSVSPWHGWDQTTPASAAVVDVGRNGTGTVHLGVDGPDGVVRGVVFHDRDRDGVRDAGEPALPGAEVCVRSPALEWSPCSDTDDQGRYRIERLVSGSYSFRHYAPAGYVSTLDEESLAFELGEDEDLVVDLGYATEQEAAPPGAPRDLRAEPGDGTVTLTWTAPEDDGGTPVLGYHVSRSTDGEQWDRAARVTAAELTWTATGLANGTEVRFRVTAYNAEGPGWSSDPVSAVPTAPETAPGTDPQPEPQPEPQPTPGPQPQPEPTAVAPSAPRSLKATARGRSVQLRWAAPATTGGAPVTDYVVQRRSGKRWVTVRDGRSARLAATVRTPKRGAHHFRVAAVNTAGQGSWTAAVRVRVRR